MNVESTPPGGPFPATSWSEIRGCQDRQSPDLVRRLDGLFRRYWGPVFGFVRRGWARDDDEARDLTQAFFLAFLEKDFLAGVDAGKGKFRSFVCAALQNFLRNERRAERALKRRPPGGLISLEGIDATDRSLAVDDGLDPVARFDEDWRRATLQAAVARARTLAGQAGKEDLIELFVAVHLEPDRAGQPTYEEIGRRLGLTYHQVKNGLSWARRLFTTCLSREVEDQVSSAEDFAEEARTYGLDVDSLPAPPGPA